jgi:hypothetical protein
MSLEALVGGKIFTLIWLFMFKFKLRVWW